MKNCTTLFVFLGLSLGSFAQTPAGQKVVQTQTVEQLQATNPQEHKAVMAYAATNGSVIMDLPKGKEARLNGEISMEKAQLIDPIKMGLTIPAANEYYRITGTDKMLMVKSLFILQQEMKTPAKHESIR